MYKIQIAHPNTPNTWITRAEADVYDPAARGFVEYKRSYPDHHIRVIRFGHVVLEYRPEGERA